MDTSTLVTGALVLAERSIRGAARRLDRPVASVAAALARLETALAVDLAHRAGATLTLTLEADRLAPALAGLAGLIETLIAPEAVGDGRARTAARIDLSFEALRRFVEVIRIGSIRAAARQLGIGQPQLTRQLRRLESELGEVLIERSTGGCRPTAAGRRAHDCAGEILSRWSGLVGRVPSEVRREAHTVRLGSVVPLGHESRIALLLAEVVARWRAARRLQHLSVVSTTAEELVGELMGGRLDLAILDCDPAPLGLDGICFSRTRMALIGAPGFHRGREAADVLLDAPVAVPSLRSGLRGIVNAIVAEGHPRIDRTPANFTEIDSISVIFNLVTRHGFVSVLPLSSFGDSRAGFEACELPGRFDLRLWLVWPRNRPAGREVDDILAYMKATD